LLTLNDKMPLAYLGQRNPAVDRLLEGKVGPNSGRCLLPREKKETGCAPQGAFAHPSAKGNQWKKKVSTP